MSERYRDEPWLREKYHGELMTTREMAEECGVSKRTIERWMDKRGVERRDSAETAKMRGSLADDNNPNAGGEKEWHDRDTLVGYYWGRGWSAAMMAERFEVHKETVLYWMRKTGVPRRDAEEHLPVMVGADNPSWKGGVTTDNRSLRNSDRYAEWRKGVFERDDYTCQGCGQRGGELHAHHISPLSEARSKALDMENGKTLCVGCHADEHPEVAVLGGD